MSSDQSLALMKRVTNIKPSLTVVLVPALTSLAFNTWSSYWNAIVDGKSHFVRNANPHLAGFSETHLKSLMWRVVIFQDDLALWVLQENYNLFFVPKK